MIICNIDKKYWGEVFNEDCEMWKNEIEWFLTKNPENDFEYYVFMEHGGVEFVDTEINLVIDGCNQDYDWGMLTELGLKELIEFYNGETWKN